MGRANRDNVRSCWKRARATDVLAKRRAAALLGSVGLGDVDPRTILRVDGICRRLHLLVDRRQASGQAVSTLGRVLGGPSRPSQPSRADRHDLASVSMIVRPFSNSVRRTVASASANVRQKSPMIARRGVHHCASLHLRGHGEADRRQICLTAGKTLPATDRQRVSQAECRSRPWRRRQCSRYGAGLAGRAVRRRRGTSRRGDLLG